MLSDMKASGNIHVFSPKDLLQDFVDYFKAECKIASEKEQPVLLMIFGHGDRKSYGIAIGGQGNPEEGPRLGVKDLEILMHGLNISLTLLTTACFSGRWLIQLGLNVSGLSAADEGNPSWSWNASLGQSFHGSVWATAVMESLIKMEDPKATQLQPGSTSIDIAHLDENTRSSTFAKLAEVIATTLKTEVNAHEMHQISFAAKDDEWENELRVRSGIPLGRFMPKTISTARKLRPPLQQ